MKKIIIYLTLILLICSAPAFAKHWIMPAYDGTIGGTAGKLDAIDACNADGAGYDLQNQDAALVWDQTTGTYSVYIFNSTSAAAESDPMIVTPDKCDGGAYAGDGRWILTTPVSASGLLDAGDFTQDSGILVGTGAGAYQEETGATLRTSIGVGTGDTPQFTGIELGNATDTTLTRSAAGKPAVEGVQIFVKTESITASTNPYSITPTGGWTSAERFVFLVNETSGDGDEVDLTETGPPANGTVATILNVSAANSLTILDDGGNMETPNGATITLEPYESVSAVYYSDRWQILDERSNVSFSTFTTTETEVIPIGYCIDGASAPDALATITSGTEKVNARTFAADADEDVRFEWLVPLDMDTTSGLKYRVVFYPTNATGPSSEVVQFEMSGCSLGDNDALDCTLGTVQTSVTASTTAAQYDRLTTAWSSAMTSTHITDLAAGETVSFKLNRDSGVASDYEQLVGTTMIELKYKRTHDTTF